VSLVRELTRKPWLAEENAIADSDPGKMFPLSSERIGLRVFLTVVTVLFSLVVVVYSDRMALSDWRPLQEPWLLWVNTAILILASVAFQRALISARQGRIDGVKTGLRAAGVCTIAFLVGQLWVAQQLAAMGFYAHTSPAVAFFYLMTGMHGVHLVGGLVAWGRTAARMWRGHDVGQLLPSVELCATYWHYLLGIWLVLFGLLVLT
jgi:cytochrome c oxidase subunit 3